MSVLLHGVGSSGELVVKMPLRHGGDPRAELRAGGWEVLRPRAARREGDDIVLEMLVETGGLTKTTAPAPPHDLDLVLEPGEQVHTHQRPAAYAVVRSARGVLMTQLSERTNAPGLWNLPGGGLDPGEDPVEGLHREVWEETGQEVVVGDLIDVVTAHWVGRAPDGRVEDFHAVRLMYAAWCPQPSDPLVHDVDGSTAAALWAPEADVLGMPLAGFVADGLPGWLESGSPTASRGRRGRRRCCRRR
ncbi:MAG: NUDIX domain-containing protein [Micrococcales bacterium]|nr:NUDIX domain-containing protein [Micrococcales bacterium]